VRVLFDTNVVLDLLLDREPFVREALYLFTRVERSELVGLLCATTVTTVHYLLSRALERREALGHVRTLLSLFEVAPVNRVVLEDALALGFSDFEDAVIYSAALHAGADSVVTRDIAGFKKTRIPIYTPEELVGILEELGK